MFRQKNDFPGGNCPFLVGVWYVHARGTGIVPQVSERTVAGMRLGLSIRAEDADEWTLEAFGPSVHLFASHFFAFIQKHQGQPAIREINVTGLRTILTRDGGSGPSSADNL